MLDGPRVPAPSLQELRHDHITEMEFNHGLRGEGLVLKRGKETPGDLDLRSLADEELAATSPRNRFQPMALVNGVVPSGYVLVAIGVAGICGSDVKNAYSNTQSYEQYSAGRILLHEASGIIVGVGDKVTGIQAGDTVALNPAVATDKSRAFLTGNAQFDPDLAMCSIDWHGFSRRFVLHPASHVCKVSPDVGLEIAALVEPMANAVRACEKAGLLDVKSRASIHGYTTHHQTEYTPSVLVIGGGSLGSMVAACASHMGAKVTVVTRSEESRDFIDRLGIVGVNTCLVKDASPGALHAINKQNGDVDGYFDAMILCTPEPGEFTKYLAALNQNIGAKVVIAGGSQGSADIHFRSHMVGEIDILLSRRYNAANFHKAARIVEENSTVLRGMISEIAAPDSGADLMLDQWKGAKGKAQINYIGER